MPAPLYHTITRGIGCHVKVTPRFMSANSLRSLPYFLHPANNIEHSTLPILLLLSSAKKATKTLVKNGPLNYFLGCPEMFFLLRLGPHWERDINHPHHNNKKPSPLLLSPFYRLLNWTELHAGSAQTNLHNTTQSSVMFVKHLQAAPKPYKVLAYRF